MASHFEHTNPVKSMLDSLRALNTVLVNIPDLEETAKVEALIVKQKLDCNRLTFGELVDYLNQSAIDIQTHDLYKRSKMMQERGR